MESGSGGHNSEEQPAGEGNINRIHSPTAECGFNGLALSPSTLLGRTMSASAVDYKGKWRNKKVHSTDEKSTPHPQSPLTSNDSSISAVPPLIGTKRKFSSHECSSTNDFSGLPKFVNSLPNSINSQMLRPMPTNLAISSASPEFVPPTQPMRQSRPNSPSTANTRPVLPRGRVASIRRESDCSTENEAAHEKLVKSAQQVSVGFEDFCLDDKLVEERKRAKSLTEPISIFTSAFLPQSSSPSPTRSNVDTLKQCYSPSAQQVVRNNIPYSPSPSPTPGSPYHRMRSMSPITVRQISKRRYTGSGGCGNTSNNGNGSGLESDGESSASSYAPPASKRQCTTPRTNCSGSSPLVRDNLNMQQFTVANLVDIPSSGRNDHYSVSSPIATGIFPNASSSSNSPIVRAQLLVDPKIAAQCINPLEVPEDDDSMVAEEEGPLVSSFCSGYDANSSTTFSSRANTPHSELLENSGTENDISSQLLPPQSSCSSDGSSQCSSSAAKIVSNNNNSNTTQQPENQQ